MSQRKVRFEVNLQNFTDSNDNLLQNILLHASNPMRKSKNISNLLLSAHYDSGKIKLIYFNNNKNKDFFLVAFSPGGSNDGLGVVILLELLSKFKQ